MNEDILAPLVVLLGGAIISIFLYGFLHRLSNRILRMFQLYPESEDVLKLSLRLISSFFCIIVFLIFLRKSLALLGLVFTTGFVESVILNSGKYFAAFLVVLGGFSISRIVNGKIQGTDTRFKSYFIFLSNLIVNTAFILTGLSIVGIDITVFLEVYRVILLVLGITLSLVIGIPLGVYISNKVNGRQPSRRRRRLKQAAKIKHL